jgi:hypothetical protein
MLVFLGLYVQEFRRWRQLNVVDMGSWQFGQIIALFVYAPILCKYLYCTICESTYFGIEATLG